MKLSVAVKAKRRTQVERHCATCGAAPMPRRRAGGSLPQQRSREAVLIPHRWGNPGLGKFKEVQDESSLFLFLTSF